MPQTHLLPTQQVGDMLGPIAAHILLMSALWAMNPNDLKPIGLLLLRSTGWRSDLLSSAQEKTTPRRHLPLL